MKTKEVKEVEGMLRSHLLAIREIQRQTRCGCRGCGHIFSPCRAILDGCKSVGYAFRCTDCGLEYENYEEGYSDHEKKMVEALGRK